MRFKGLDLNLLVALDVLLEERSVSRAAERLHLSQPSASAALARLREYFNDPLLESQGKRMIPTAFALRLRPLLADVLGDVDRMLGQVQRFDPATSTRWFHIAVSDYLVAVLFPRFVRLVQEQAPLLRFDLQSPTDSTYALMDQGEIDVLLTPQEHCARDHPTELLFEERFVVAGWAENPVFDGELTEEAFYEAGHVVTAMGQIDRASFAEDRLHARGRERRVEIIAFSFTQVPDLLVGTRRLSVMHERLARSMAERYAIRYCHPPFDFPIMREMAQFHRSRATDPALQWLLARLREAAAG
jgi:DNA-binding transcriptional LysR family regulator